ncbi:MAG: hypoxanthine phosphoribosyltransferase [Marinoscillum sp.]|uniref:hypoxanthine phosphoribosyltransferase n=1 Tax=Marinoscillum sp. TaxID=2024838 RepID=UPI0033054403
MTEEKIALHGKSFELFLSEKEIADAVGGLAEKINRDFHGKEMVILGVLDGAFMLLGDLLKQLDVSLTLELVKLKSYEGVETTGVVKSLIGLSDELKGKHVVVVEDIIDTGITLSYLLGLLEEKKPASVSLTTLLIKKEVFNDKFPVHYYGIAIPNRFVVGYGMDYDGHGRQLSQIYAAID